MRRLFAKLSITTCLIATPLAHSLATEADETLKINPTYGYDFGIRVDFDEFIAPNETNPSRIRPLLAEIPQGAYVAIGTERGFMSASMLPQIDLLVLVDISEAATVFNRINTVLLKIADSRQDYLQLRLRSTHSDWLLRAMKVGISVEEQELMSAAHYNWWDSKVRKNIYFRQFHRNPRWRWWPGVAFKNANYLFYDRNFQKIQTLARDNRIWVYHTNVEETSALYSILTDIRNAGRTVSVWDESNIEMYARVGTSSNAIDSLLPFTEPSSVHLSTELDNLVNGLYLKRNGPWRLYAHTFRFLKQYKRVSLDGVLIDNNTECTDLLTNSYIHNLIERPHISQ